MTNLDCIISPIWYAPSKKLSPAEVTKIKQTIATRRLTKMLWLSPRPLALLRALGREIIPQARATTLNDDQQRGFTTALQALQFISELQPHLLLTHNPHLWHQQPPTSSLIDELIAQISAKGFNIVRMADWMPAEMGSSESKTWYMFNGHWSDQGAEAYGKAIYRVVQPASAY